MRRGTAGARVLPLVLVGAVLLTACVRRESVPALTGPLVPVSKEEPLSMQLPRFPSGQPYSLASDRGKVVLLDIWATWCEPCKDALPLYEQLQKQYGAAGFRVYAVNIDEDPRLISEFLEETKVDLPILHDKDAAFSEQRLGVKLMPTTFLIDRKGHIRHVHEGFAEEQLGLYQSEIEALLSEQAD